MTQVIEFVALREFRKTFDKRDAFQLRTDRPALWLQKVCFFILKKLNAFYIGESVTIERHVLDGRTFIDRLFLQQEEIKQFFNMEPKKLLIGAEDYANLMQEVVATQRFNFNAEYGYGRTIMGLTVEVIPWMRGCLVMPNKI
ncbi:MAG: hypothetical protein WC714_29020 [Candidatus Obscuribacterales bacterium]|jgi:hypothetical protein